ncbi:hypothetical protein [Nonomuraea sp. NEAU-A123]|uniref:hypothetical protein n=1 Tax=Nonomuraea sp. NEAU-A123 TaxID=2839649 RepID=UPI001BE4C815|nr:hypothetical protein [Nonomuraea sp. NEAU-A123]MBT2229067.1 hypothetical protein [Nonomuraea sp. NEAU-A123]
MRTLRIAAGVETASLLVLLVNLFTTHSGAPSWARCCSSSCGRHTCRAGAVWLALAVEAAMLAATATYWAPLQIRLSRRNDRRLLRLLLATHWIRVGLVTAFGALLCWMVTLAFI